MSVPLGHRAFSDPAVVTPTSHPLAPAWVAPLFAVLATALVPWIIWLAVTLPARERADHYRLAWVGFDVMLLATLLGVAITAMSGSDWLERAATAAAVLLLIDAWFDVMTSGRGKPFDEALAQAAAIEIPLAIASFWTASHADAVRQRCAQLRRREPRRPRPAGATVPTHTIVHRRRPPRLFPEP